MSTILSADDLNDFIAPGVACIKPVEIEKTSEFAEIQIGADGVPVEADTNQKLPAAQISLTDCLACSGCITSSEAVLVELQSPKELLRVVDSCVKVCVVSVSPQVRASLATAHSLSLEEVDARLTHVFIHMLGFSHIVGTETGRILSLESSWAEARSTRGGASKPSGPIISSVCPGWALYAEKTHPHILPYLSTVKSPQQITGHLLKSYVADQGTPLENIYHVSLMPCFDKKLESARPKNTMAADVQEVDLVLTAKEIVQMLADRFETSFEKIPTTTTYQLPNQFADSWKSNGGSSSGGYLWYILENIAGSYPGSSIEVVTGKNSDITEFKVVSEGATVWTGAQIYGFRNIQNVVRKLKPGKRVVTKRGIDPLSYGYMEIMACPGGCTNGGGQLGATAGVAPKSWHKAVEQVYDGIEKLQLRMNPTVSVDPRILYTEFKPIEPDNSIPQVLTVGSQW